MIYEKFIGKWETSIGYYSLIEITYGEVTTSTPSFPFGQYEMSRTDLSTFQNPIEGLPDDYDGTITYSSGNTEVANVASDGTVTLTGAKGMAVITAQLTETIIAKTICAIFQNQMCKNRDFLHIFLASFSADFGRFLNAV